MTVEAGRDMWRDRHPDTATPDDHKYDTAAPINDPTTRGRAMYHASRGNHTAAAALQLEPEPGADV